MSDFYDLISDELEEYDSFGSEDILFQVRSGVFGSEDGFGVDYSHDAATMKLVQAKINSLGYTPPLVVDGAIGPKTIAGVKWAQAKYKLVTDGIVGDATLTALGLKADSGASPGPTSAGKPPPAGTPTPVKIATVIAALKQAAQEKGYTLSPQLLSLMIGQLRGAEGAYPGVQSSLGGTNNMGAAQVTSSLASVKKGLAGWGAFAHRDSDPDKGAYIGWYWIAPSPLEAARHWFGDNWWGPALAKANPQSATDYAAILYRQGYFGGMTPHGSDGNDPNSPSGQKNVAAYASAISRGVASASELAQTPDNPATMTVNPGQFADLTARKLTQDLFDKAKSGGIGSAWGYLLPATWADFTKNNGVVWFGPPPIPKASKRGWIIGGIATLVSLVAGGIALKGRKA